MANDEWHIMRLYGGYGNRMAAQNFMGPDHYGEVYPVPYWAFAVWNDEHKILVDTAVGEQDEHLWYTNVPNIMTEEQKLPNNLKAALGWETDDVDIVINTHLHWDHTGNNHLFKNATFYVQREDYEYGIKYGQNEGFAKFYKKSNFDKTAVPYHKWHFVDGEEQILPGILLFPTPGHGKAMQSVLVYTDEGEACIAGDAVNTMYSIENDLVTVAMMDAQAQRDSYAKIRQVADVILTSHELPGETAYDHQTSGWPKL